MQEKRHSKQHNAKQLLFLIVLLFLFHSLFAQTEKSVHYSGGMLIFQPGYATTTSNHQDISGISFGLGGILRLYFSNSIAAGIYGGTQKTGYSSTNSENSSISLGYGGPFVGFSRKVGRYRFTTSAFAGMGTVRNLHIESQSNSKLNDAYLYKHSALVFSPILSTDIALTQRLLLTLQAVYLIAKYDGSKTLFNPTFQVGILFNR